MLLRLKRYLDIMVIVGSFIVGIYGFMWVVGIAPITNIQAQDIAIEVVEDKLTSVQRRQQINMRNLSELNRHMNELSNKIERLDERSSFTIEQLREQRDLQNEILFEIRRNSSNNNRE